MQRIMASLALLSGVIGAGFASGREILRFFAGHGDMAFAAVLCACLSLGALFLRLASQMEKAGCASLAALCRLRLGRRLGALCPALFFLLYAVTGGAMLSAACELGALLLPLRHAYGLTGAFSLCLALLMARAGIRSLALPGALLAALFPFLLVRLLLLPAGEACFLPAMTPDLPVFAMSDGALYAALNAAMLAGALPMLLDMDRRARRGAVSLFVLLFGALLSLGVLVCRRHMPRLYQQPLPFVALSKDLGALGYFLCGVSLFAAAFSTLVVMILSMARLLPAFLPHRFLLASLICLFFARVGFAPLVSSGYPTLGALCAALLVLLCAPGCPHTPRSGGRESEGSALLNWGRSE